MTIKSCPPADCVAQYGLPGQLRQRKKKEDSLKGLANSPKLAGKRHLAKHCHRGSVANMFGFGKSVFLILTATVANAFLATSPVGLRIPSGMRSLSRASRVSISKRTVASVNIDPVTEIGLLAADLTGFKPTIIARESWAWSHSSRNQDSIVLELTKKIEEEGGKDRANPALIRARRRIMSLLLQHDYSAYVQSATVLGGMIDRKDLPNVQDIPYPAVEGSSARKAPQVRLGGRQFTHFCFFGVYSFYMQLRSDTRSKKACR
jgi:hypothetical protein